MKILYTFIFVFALMFGVYFTANDFSFDNNSFSSYLITALCILLISTVALIGIAAFISARRKKGYKGIMTIQQYYLYKDAR